MNTDRKTFEKRRKVATRLLNRRYGATVDQLAKRLNTDPRKVRSLIDNLRRSGLDVQNTAPNRFLIVEAANDQEFDQDEQKH